jgi:hypothetical protein
MERDARLGTSRFLSSSEVVIAGLRFVAQEEIGVVVDESFRSYPHDIEEEVFEMDYDFLHFVVVYFIVIEIHGVLPFMLFFRSEDFRGSQPDMLR